MLHAPSIVAAVGGPRRSGAARTAHAHPPRLPGALRRFDGVVHDLIVGRRHEDGAPADLLGALLAARDDETGRAMSDRQVRDEVSTLLFAGHETTALALTWYLLAQHRDVEARLYAE